MILGKSDQKVGQWRRLRLRRILQLEPSALVGPRYDKTNIQELQNAE